MKYQAPSGVTALFCADAEIAPDENGVFNAPEVLADELAAHGCVACADSEQTASASRNEVRPRPGRARGKAN
jgi:hypothetical protein